MSREVEITSVEGRHLRFRQPAKSSDESMWSFSAALSTETAEASVAVWELGPGMASFFKELAAAWRGFDGTKEYGSLEGNLVLSCEHDGRGTVTCQVSLRQPWPPTWNLSAEMSFGAGAHLETIADEVAAFVEEGLGV